MEGAVITSTRPYSSYFRVTSEQLVGNFQRFLPVLAQLWVIFTVFYLYRWSYEYIYCFITHIIT